MGSPNDILYRLFVSCFVVGVSLFMPILIMGQNKMNPLEDLKRILHSESRWIKIHAAEFLLWENMAVDEVRDVYLKEEQLYGNVPMYRIGIWRVLAQIEAGQKNRQYWVDKIVAAYQNPEGEDRLHAIETLAKLNVNLVEKIPRDLKGSMDLYSLWNYAVTSESRKEEVRIILLEGIINNSFTDLETRVASFVLRFLGNLSEDQFGDLYDWAQSERIDASLRGNLLATLWIIAPAHLDPLLLNKLKEELLAMQNRPDVLNQILTAFALRWKMTDLTEMCNLYALASNQDNPDYNSDIHATAAYMMLKSMSEVEKH